MNEQELDKRTKQIVSDYLAGLITNREIAERLATLGAALAPIRAGDIDLNTGLRY